MFDRLADLVFRNAFTHNPPRIPWQPYGEILSKVQDRPIRREPVIIALQMWRRYCPAQKYRAFSIPSPIYRRRAAV
jgi:hypothetical protein